jgi:hypothetical protein
LETFKTSPVSNKSIHEKLCVEIAYLIDHEIVFSKLDEKMFSDTVSGGQNPPWCNEGTAAKYLTVLVQNGNLP